MKHYKITVDDEVVYYSNIPMWFWYMMFTLMGFIFAKI